MSSENSLTYSEIKELAKMSESRVISNRLNLVSLHFGDEVFSQTEDDFYSVLKKYFDIQTQKKITEEEADFCNQILDSIEQADVFNKNSILCMVSRTKQKLNILLESKK